MRSGIVAAIIFILSIVTTGCERDFEIDLDSNEPLLIVEGYINNELPLYNYVILSRSQDYYSPDYQSTPIRGATVTITEGELLSDKTFSWNNAGKTTLTETSVPQISGNSLPGVYFDSRLATDSANALKGIAGKYYLLEIVADNKTYSAITYLPPVVPIDSLTTGYYFRDEEDSTDKARLTVHYKDPDTIGNTQMYYWQRDENRGNIGWGGLSSNRFTLGTDDLSNGEAIHLTMPTSFVLSDSVSFYMASVERRVYNFWESFRKVENNGGPFATPVSLQSTISGENVAGCFSGFSISTRSIVIR